MTVLAHIAGATSSIRLGIGIYLLALRNPVLVGRTIASLDVLSNGRLDMAVGLGWTPDEYSFTNNVWDTRGRRTNEMIRCLRTLFEDDEPEFHGEFFDFPGHRFSTEARAAAAAAHSHRRQQPRRGPPGRHPRGRLVRLRGAQHRCTPCAKS